MTTRDVDTVLTSLRRVGGRAALAADAAAAATAHVPAVCRGTDPSGAVSVTLDATHLPTEVRVSADWSRRLAPDAFGAAVTGACRAAQHARLAEWGDRLARIPTARPAATTSLPPDPPTPRADREAVSVADLQRRAHLAATTPTAVRGAEFIGVDATGRVRVTVTEHGVTAGVADPRWTADQSAARLATAVRQAVEQARRLRSAEQAARREQDAQRRAVTDDAMALLRHLAAGRSSRGPTR